MKFAFLIMGEYDPAKDRAEIGGGSARIVGVSALAEASRVARELCADGVDCIELCGAFGPDGAEKIIRATGGAVPVGYVTHLPEQDGLYARVFGDEGKN